MKAKALSINNISPAIPVLTPREVQVASKPLGEGGFCTVSAVLKIQLQLKQQPGHDNDADQTQKEDNSPPSSSSHEPVDENKEQVRQIFAKRFDNYYLKYYSHRNIHVPGQGKPRPPIADPNIQKPPRICLKRVRPCLKKRGRYKTGVNDLMAEVSVLSKCSHPNIIGIYAVGFDDDGNTTSNEDDYDTIDTVNSTTNTNSQRMISFAIIDQLRCTLRNKIYKWREDQGTGIIPSRNNINDLWLQRMVVIMKMADAINYLHSKGFIHRDINPENIGFADDDVVKLFDFGLAKSLTSESENSSMMTSMDHDGDDNQDSDQLFNLTTNTGTPRYMAPEVALEKPYGFKVDVFSFALVMHEVLSLTKPYIRVKSDQFHQNVVLDGLRPPIEESWPDGIRDLLERMWSSDSRERPTSKQVVEALGDLLRGSDSDLYPKTRFDRWKKRLTG